MSERDLWLIECDNLGVYDILNVRDGASREDAMAAAIEQNALRSGDRLVRYVPAPVWRKFDPENPPAIGEYAVESKTAAGTSFGVADMKRTGVHRIPHWSRDGYMVDVLRYTELPQPPEDE